MRGHLISIFLLCCTIISCRRNENNIQIKLYKAVRTDQLYKSIMMCDSITHAFISNREVDTSSLTLSEIMEMKNELGRPILARIRNIYHDVPDSGYAKFYSSVFLGDANSSDTTKISGWLNNDRCNLEAEKVKYKWIPNDNKKTSSLIAMRDEPPLSILTYKDIDSIKLIPVKGIQGMLDMFSGEKHNPTSYSLNIIFKAATRVYIKDIVNKDKTAGYVVTIQSKEYFFMSELRRSRLNTNNFLESKHIESSEISDFTDRFGTDVYLMKDE